MSARGGRNFVAARNRPAQVFKKRNAIFDTNILAGTAGVIISTITLGETGTVYSVKVAIQGIHTSGVTGDQNLINLWIRCAPSGTAVPNLASAVALDTLNGFFVGRLNMANGSNSGFGTGLVEKFRFRRKCDANSLLQLMAQSDFLGGGTSRAVNVGGVLTAVIRVR